MSQVRQLHKTDTNGRNPAHYYSDRCTGTRDWICCRWLPLIHKQVPSINRMMNMLVVLCAVIPADVFPFARFLHTPLICVLDQY